MTKYIILKCPKCQAEFRVSGEWDDEQAEWGEIDISNTCPECGEKIKGKADLDEID